MHREYICRDLLSMCCMTIQDVLTLAKACRPISSYVHMKFLVMRCNSTMESNSPQHQHPTGKVIAVSQAHHVDDLWRIFGLIQVAAYQTGIGCQPNCTGQEFDGQVWR